MSININDTLDAMVRDKKISYMEAILKYTDDVDCEIEMVAKMLNRKGRTKHKNDCNCDKCDSVNVKLIIEIIDIHYNR